MRPAESSPAIARDAEIARVLDAVRWVLGGVARSRSVQPSVFPERLLALRHVESLAAGDRELCVAPGTVVTPLARDELKRRGIAVRWISRHEVDAVSRRGEWAFVIEGEGGVLSALRRSWLDGAEGWRELAALPDAVRWVAESGERGVLLVTEQAAVAVWRANQVAGVRAASAETSAAVDRAIRSLGVNLLAVEPEGKPLPLLKQLAALSDAVRWVAESDERGVLVVTGQAAVAVWRANQVAGIRAASAETSAAVDRAVRSLGVNLLAVEPDGKPLPLLKQLAASFRSAGAPRLPDTLFEEAAPCVSPK